MYVKFGAFTLRNSIYREVGVGVFIFWIHMVLKSAGLFGFSKLLLLEYLTLGDGYDNIYPHGSDKDSCQVN